ncbi:hypothetical protein ACROYT_G023742 [Oculina patagonica]
MVNVTRNRLIIDFDWADHRNMARLLIYLLLAFSIVTFTKIVNADDDDDDDDNDDDNDEDDDDDDDDNDDDDDDDDDNDDDDDDDVGR